MKDTMKLLLLVVFAFALIESKTLEDDVEIEKMEVKAYEPFSIQLNDRPSAAYFWNIVDENKLDNSNIQFEEKQRVKIDPKNNPKRYMFGGPVPVAFNFTAKQPSNKSVKVEFVFKRNWDSTYAKKKVYEITVVS